MPVELSSQEYARHVSDVVWLGGVPWHPYGRALMPLSMPHIRVEVDRADLRRAMSRKKALLACWTTQWDAYDGSEWWWVACDQRDYDVENLASAAGRQSVRKGLRECSVRRVEAGEFQSLTYPIQRAAIERYGGQPPTKAGWTESVERLAAYQGAEFWGAFHEERMAAFAACLIVDGAVDLSSAKSDPEFHRHEPNAALFYTLCKHYLNNGLGYVTNGARTLSHPTSINAFLEKLGFRKVFCRVDVQLSPSARVLEATSLARWGQHLGLKRLFGARWLQLESFEKLTRIAETFGSELTHQD